MKQVDVVQNPPDEYVGEMILPAEPLIKISPVQKQFSLKQIIEFRELIYYLIWRDLKVRYKQTFLGVVWVILQPFLMTLVFTVFLGQLIKVPSDGVPYPLFVYAGLLSWTFFSNSVSASSYSLISNSFMITKIYFPHIIIPLTTMGVRVVDFFIASVTIIIFMVIFGVNFTTKLLFLPLFILQILLITLAFSILFSAITAKLRDFGTILPVLIQIWMFVSPVVYPKSLIPENWQMLYSLNPFVGILDGFRASLFGIDFDWSSIIISMILTIIIFFSSITIFKKMDRNLADTL